MLSTLAWSRSGRLRSTWNFVTWQRSNLVVVLCLATVVVTSRAQTVSTLATFNGTNGASPNSLVQSLDGKLWGTSDGSAKTKCGTVFKMAISGTLSTAFAFECDTSKEPDGFEPQELLQASDGNFYGVTFFGGTGGGGTVFKLTPGGSLNFLYNFGGTNLPAPVGLTQGTDGDFYGATYGGGLAESYGTIFKISAQGALKTLYEFDFTHGAQPYAGLIEGTDGNFYGTTYSGGTYGVGTVYKITHEGTLTVLHSFGEHTYDPDFPVTLLVQGSDGNFYGTTSYGGGPDNDGAIFKITPSGVFTIIHSFTGSDGYFPAGPLVQDTDGNFYGTAAGGANDKGIIFKIMPDGVFTTLYSFDGADGGAGPYGLMQDTNGIFYGLTGGGALNDGTIFSLSTGLKPFVSFLPPLSEGEVGNIIPILGQGFTSATAVSFNGTPATVEIKSSNYLTAAVPDGASTGFVTVSTSSSTLKSNKVFRVVPRITSFSPMSGSAGTVVTISGVSLTQTSRVTFGGVGATSFTVNSDSEVMAEAPSGAKSGHINITTHGGFAISSGTFTVTP